VLRAGADQTLGVSFVPSDTADYTNTSATTTITVNPATLTVTAPSATIVYGTPVPSSFTPTYTGFVNGDTTASLTTKATCTTPATNISPPGSYPVTCSGAVDPNYTFANVAGTVTITKAPTTLTAARASVRMRSITFSATLTRTDNGAAIPGQTVVFSVRGQNACHATTNSSGVASCTDFGLVIAGGTYTANYAGNADYKATSGTGKL
jgi:hypothetical protein